MDKSLTYYIHEEYLREKGESLKHRLQQWLNKSFNDVTVLMFILGTESSLIIDCEYEERSIEEIRECVELFLKKFGINYDI